MQMRVLQEKIGRKEANLSGEDIVDTIDAFIDRGWLREDDSVIRSCRNSEIDATCLLAEFTTCIRNRYRQRFGAGMPAADPGQTYDNVPIHAVVTAVNGLHIGH